MVSKMVTDRIASANWVAQAADTHASRIGTELDSIMSSHLRAGETAPDWKLVVRLLGRHLISDLDQLEAADEAHDREQTEDVAARRARDEASEQLYASLVALRGGLEANMGSEVVKQLGFTGRTREAPQALVRSALQVAERLPRVTANRSPVFAGFQFDATAAQAGLRDQAGIVEQALKNLQREERESEATLVEKQRALDQHDNVFTGSAGMLSSLFRLVGDHELARRIKPSETRPGETEEPVQSPDTTPPTQ